MSTKERVAELMAAGHSQADTAQQLGITASYVSQLQQDDEYQRLYNKLVNATKISTHQQAAAIDSHYDRVELKLAEFIDANSSAVIASLASKPATLLSTIKVINGLKRRGVGEGQPAQQTAAVNLQLPSFLLEAVLPDVRKNANNEVIEVSGKPLVSLPSSALAAKVESFSPLEPSLIAETRPDLTKF